MANARAKSEAIAALLKLGIRPRLVDVDVAAAYVGLSAGAFQAAVAAGRYPQPLSDGRRKLWDLRAIDAAIDRRSGLTPLSDRESPDAIMEAIDAAE
jgi:predicted DNA-binding transcriptional regulator AlpA